MARNGTILSELRGTPFVKMTGSGNDFVFFDARVKEDEVISRTRHLHERCAAQLAQVPRVSSHGVESLDCERKDYHASYARPVIPHQRRRQTIQIASRTIRFDIFDSPSVRSWNTIGISAMRKSRFHARKLISI